METRTVWLIIVICALLFIWMLDSLAWDANNPAGPVLTILRLMLGIGAFVTGIWIGLVASDPDVLAEQSIARYPWVWAVTASTLGVYALLYSVNVARKALQYRASATDNREGRPPGMVRSIAGLLIVATVATVGTACYSHGVRLHQANIEFSPVLARLPSLTRQTQATGHPNMHGELLVAFQRGTAPYLVRDGKLTGYVQPDSLEDVGTVLLVTENAKVVRSYSPGGTDYQWILKAHLFNWPQGDLVATATFLGSKPEDRSGRPGGADIYGYKPEMEVERWLDKQFTKQ